MQSTSSTKDKVSVKQLVMVIVVMTVSPTVRFLPSFAAKHAEEAGWISPLVAAPVIGITVFFLSRIIKNFKDKSTSEIIMDILGKYVGTMALVVHMIWTFLLLSFYLRFNGERLVSSIYPNVDLNFFIIVTLIVVSYILRSGATAIARIGEILFPIIIILFSFIMLLLLPNIRSDALLPISIHDTVPAIRASIGTLSIYAYLFVIFLFSDSIVGKEKTGKLFFKGTVVLMLILLMMMVTTFGMLGSTVVARAPIPFLITVKQISVLDTIENIESVVIAMWMLSDALLISVMSILTLNIAKTLFKLSDTRNAINILFVLVFITANALARNRVELDMFAASIVTITNTTIGFGTPALLFIVGKIRKKL